MKDSASPAPLDAQLRQSAPAMTPPAGLHAEIVAAVRSASRAAPPQAGRGGRALIGALVLVLALGAWWLARRPSADVVVVADSMSGMLRETQKVPERASAAAIAPLAEELEYLNRDFEGALKFVLASVP